MSGLPSVTRAGAGSQETAGSYSNALVASGASANNYDFAYVPGKFTIVPADQLLVRVANGDALYGSTPIYSIISAEYLDGSNVIRSLPVPTVVGNQCTIDDGTNNSVSFNLTPTGALQSSGGHTTVGSYQLGASSVSMNHPNFSTLTVVGALTVNPKGVSATATAGTSKTYDGSAAMTGLALSLSGLQAGDLVTATGNGMFSDKNVAIGNKAYTVSQLALAGTDAGNYFLWDGSNPVSSLTGTGSITPATLTVNYTGLDKVYDRLSSATVTTSDNRVAGDSLGLSFTANFANVNGVAGTAKNVGMGKTIDVTGVSLTGADAGNYVVASTGTATASITPKALVISGITAQDKTYNGNTTATLDTSSTLQRNGLVAGDDVTVTATGSFASANAGANQTVTITSVYGGDSANYSITGQASTVASITPRQVAVSATGGVSKTYDGNTSMTNVSIGLEAVSGVSESGVLAMDSGPGALTVSGLGSFSSANVSRDANGNVLSDKGYTLSNLQLTGTAASNYVISGGATSVSGNNGRIDPAALTVTGNSATGTYSGHAQSVSGFTVRGLQGNDTALTVTGNSATGTYSGQAQSVNGFTVTGLQGNDTAASLSTVSASGATRSNAGVTSNVVSAGDETNYSVSVINGSLTITPAPLSVVLVGTVGKVYDGDTGALLTPENYQLSGWMAGEGATVTQASGRYADKNVGSGKLVSAQLGEDHFAAQNGTLLSNYTLPTAAQGQVGQVTPALISVAGLTAASKVYDGNTTATLDSSQAQLTGKVAGDNLSLASAHGHFSDKNVGVGKTVSITDLSLGGADAGNYQLATSTSTTTADITRLGEVRWIGGPNGNWFDPANWEGGAVPDRANVAKVILPQGVTAEFDLTGTDPSSAPVALEELGQAGSLTMKNGSLTIGSGGLHLDRFDQAGGSLMVEGPTELNALTQSGGAAQLRGGLTVLTEFEQSGTGRLQVVGKADIWTPPATAAAYASRGAWWWAVTPRWTLAPATSCWRAPTTPSMAGSPVAVQATTRCAAGVWKTPPPWAAP
ncbi:MAG: hypothetical protein C4K60_06285 [Ideonella sp. MAG2]|nr:MAG: hypothetical protein C4K60_06285 [Ideonella sp. MAG2]